MPRKKQLLKNNGRDDFLPSYMFQHYRISQTSSKKQDNRLIKKLGGQKIDELHKCTFRAETNYTKKNNYQEKNIYKASEDLYNRAFEYKNKIKKKREDMTNQLFKPNLVGRNNLKRDLRGPEDRTNLGLEPHDGMQKEHRKVKRPQEVKLLSYPETLFLRMTRQATEDIHHKKSISPQKIRETCERLHKNTFLIKQEKIARQKEQYINEMKRKDKLRRKKLKMREKKAQETRKNIKKTLYGEIDLKDDSMKLSPRQGGSPAKKRSRTEHKRNSTYAVLGKIQDDLVENSKFFLINYSNKNRY